MIGLPEPLAAYLTAYDVLTRDAVLRAHAGLRDELLRAETRDTLLAWLAGDDAWSPEGAGVLPAVLEFLRPAAVASEAARVRPLLMHPDPPVRRGAFEFLLTPRFSGRDPEALSLLLAAMLTDGDETVRRAGADYASRAATDGEMGEFLKRWLALAPVRGWDGTESHELVRRLLGAA